jgi:hypothetical protein
MKYWISILFLSPSAWATDEFELAAFNTILKQGELAGGTVSEVEKMHRWDLPGKPGSKFDVSFKISSEGRLIGKKSGTIVCMRDKKVSCTASLK